MPDKLGNLTEAEQSSIVNALNENGVKGICSECDGTDVTCGLDRQVILIPVYGLQTAYIFVKVRCSRCGFTRLFDAMKLGIPPVKEWGQDAK